MLAAISDPVSHCKREAGHWARHQTPIAAAVAIMIVDISVLRRWGAGNLILVIVSKKCLASDYT
jgi:hypothetical protein